MTLKKTFLLFACLFIGMISFYYTIYLTQEQLPFLSTPPETIAITETYVKDVKSTNQDATPIHNQTINTISVKKGDTLEKIFKKQKISSRDIRSLIRIAKKKKIVSTLPINSKISFHYNSKPVNISDIKTQRPNNILDKIVIQLDKLHGLEFIKHNNTFVTRNTIVPLKSIITQHEVEISSGFTKSLNKAGINNANISKMVELYSNKVNFQKHIKKGDSINIILEKFITPKGEFSHYGDFLYASLKLQEKKYDIYRYSIKHDKQTKTLYFSENGISLDNNLLFTPVKGSIISGYFGYRKKHPVLGYGAMHKGVDFAAPTGTPIYSSGNGVVKFAGWKNGYGRFIIIQHNKKISTAYAHASKFAKHIKEGVKVQKGEVIAYVGQSGRATGPHLHYEVRVNGKHVNPLKTQHSPDIHLQGEQLASFLKHTKKIHELNKNTRDAKHTAESNKDSIDSILQQIDT